MFEPQITQMELLGEKGNHFTETWSNTSLKQQCLDPEWLPTTLAHSDIEHTSIL